MKTLQHWFGGLARLLDGPVHIDERGALQPLDFKMLPFMPARVFCVSGVPAGTARGGHGHRSGVQLLACVQGRIEVLMRHGGGGAGLVLTPDGRLLQVGAGVWCRQTYVEPGSVLLVLASEPYSADSYFTECP